MSQEDYIKLARKILLELNKMSMDMFQTHFGKGFCFDISVSESRVDACVYAHGIVGNSNFYHLYPFFSEEENLKNFEIFKEKVAEIDELLYEDLNISPEYEQYLNSIISID